MMLITWSSHDHHMIVTWSSHDLHIIFTWSSHDLAWSSHDHHMISHDPYTILTRSSHNPHTILTCSLHKWLMAHCWCVDMHPVGSCACAWRYCNMATNPLSSESWHSFLESSLLEELRLHLQLGNLLAASCIWIRHQVRKKRRGEREDERGMYVFAWHESVCSENDCEAQRYDLKSIFSIRWVIPTPYTDSGCWNNISTNAFPFLPGWPPIRAGLQQPPSPGDVHSWLCPLLPVNPMAHWKHGPIPAPIHTGVSGMEWWLLAHKLHYKLAKRNYVYPRVIFSLGWSRELEFLSSLKRSAWRT